MNVNNEECLGQPPAVTNSNQGFWKNSTGQMFHYRFANIFFTEISQTDLYEQLMFFINSQC